MLQILRLNGVIATCVIEILNWHFLFRDAGSRLLGNSKECKHHGLTLIIIHVLHYPNVQFKEALLWYVVIKILHIYFSFAIKRIVKYIHCIQFAKKLNVLIYLICFILVVTSCLYVRIYSCSYVCNLSVYFCIWEN